MREVKESFSVDAFVGNATDWERVCMGNLVGLPVIVVPTGFKNISNPPPTATRRKTTITTGIYAPPHRDHIVSMLHLPLLTEHGDMSIFKTLLARLLEHMYFNDSHIKKLILMLHLKVVQKDLN